MNSPEREAIPSDWHSNYFNYFTEIEEHFQRARGTSLFLLSPLDWALIESWKAAGIPVEAVIRGVETAFEKWRSRKQRRRHINSLAYCAQAVMEAAERVRSKSTISAADATFSGQEIRDYLLAGAAALRHRGEQASQEAAERLQALAHDADEQARDLEQLEQRLIAIEERITAALRLAQTEDDLVEIRRELEAELKPYRSKMTAEQLSMLERRYVEAALFRRAGLPRLSLFYMR